MGGLCNGTADGYSVAEPPRKFASGWSGRLIIHGHAAAGQAGNRRVEVQALHHHGPVQLRGRVYSMETLQRQPAPSGGDGWKCPDNAWDSLNSPIL